MRRGEELEEEVARLQVENKELREQFAQALAIIAKLQVEIEQLRTEVEQLRSSSTTFPPSFIKPSTPKKEGAEKKPRRKRAKAHNAGRRRETPTQVVEHKIEACPTCRYPLRHTHLAFRRQVIELPPPQPVDITEHQVFKSWCARCERWHYAPVDLSGQVIGQGRSQSRMGVRIATLIAYLRTTLRLPVRQIKDYLLTMHQLHISNGEIAELLHRVAQAAPVKKASEALHERVRTGKIVHGDETGWREAGQNGYIWCFLRSCAMHTRW